MGSSDRTAAVKLAKRLIIDVLWKTANIEVDGITFPDTQEIFEGRAPGDMSVNQIVVVNNLKRAWQFLFGHVDEPLDLSLVSSYNGIIGAGLHETPGTLRTHGVRIGGTDWTPGVPDIQDVDSQIYRSTLLEDPEARGLAQFCMISRGQWFADGNKRTALMAANHTLIHEGVGILTIGTKDKRDFTTRLLKFYESNDSAALTAWLSLHSVGLLPGGLTRTEIQTTPIKSFDTDPADTVDSSFGRSL